MRCTTCDNEFEPKRADAKFCSSTCRSKASRIMTKRDVDELRGAINHTVKNPEEELSAAPEKIKKDIVEPRHCANCVTFESGIHWCPSKDCYCFQTSEEQKADIKRNQEACSHPVAEKLYSRCGHCFAFIPWVKEHKAPLMKLKDTKNK